MKMSKIFLLAGLIFLLAVPSYAKDLDVTVVQKSGRISAGVGQVTTNSYNPNPLNLLDARTEEMITLGNPNNDRNPNTGALRPQQDILVTLTITGVAFTAANPPFPPTSQMVGVNVGPPSGYSVNFTFQIPPETTLFVSLRNLFVNSALWPTPPPMPLLVENSPNPNLLQTFFSFQIDWNGQRNTRFPLLFGANQFLTYANGNSQIQTVPWIIGE